MLFDVLQLACILVHGMSWACSVTLDSNDDGIFNRFECQMHKLCICCIEAVVTDCSSLLEYLADVVSV